jgi:glutathione peroxidase
MKKSLFILLSFILCQFVLAQKQTLYDFKVQDIDGKEFDMSQLKGKKVLIVNVASKCGYTPQYKELEALYQQYKDQNFIIIGFPANNFLNQEPGTNEEIKTFCTLKYGVSFPIMSKISVKGKNMAPIYKWLTKKSNNGTFDAPIKWNFQKFMIDEQGRLVDFARPKDVPHCDKIINWLKN